MRVYIIYLLLLLLLKVETGLYVRIRTNENKKIIKIKKIILCISLFFEIKTLKLSMLHARRYVYILYPRWNFFFKSLEISTGHTSPAERAGRVKWRKKKTHTTTDLLFPAACNRRWNQRVPRTRRRTTAYYNNNIITILKSRPSVCQIIIYYTLNNIIISLVRYGRAQQQIHRATRCTGWLFQQAWLGCAYIEHAVFIYGFAVFAKYTFPLFLTW